MTRIKDFRSTDNWDEVVNRGRTAIGKRGKRGKSVDEVNSNLKTKLLLAEHSIIRALWIKWLWVEIPYWVTVHFKTHSIGTLQDTRTQRTKEDRSNEPQGALVEHEMACNAQAMINISRKRLCERAAKETREAWEDVKMELYSIEPELAKLCVRECVYRGFCPEVESCGFVESNSWKYLRGLYLERG